MNLGVDLFILNLFATLQCLELKNRGYYYHGQIPGQGE